MQYPDGSEIKVGDKVIIDGVAHGEVVISCDDSGYNPEYPKSDWPSITEGILVVFKNGSRLHIPDLRNPGEGPHIIERKDKRVGSPSN